MDKRRTNCPNCGAPIKHYYNYNCEYCGTFLHNTDEQIKKIENADIRIKRVDIERSPIEHSILLTIYGVTFPRTHWYEEGQSEIVISGDNLGTPVAHRIKIPIDYFYETYYDGHFEKILKIIQDSLPPIFKQEGYFIYREVVEKLYRADRRLNI